MIVCSCNAFSDRQVLDAIAASQGLRTPGEIYRCLGCPPQCGRCARTIRNLLDQAAERNCSSCTQNCPAAHLGGMAAAE